MNCNDSILLSRDCVAVIAGLLVTEISPGLEIMAVVVTVVVKGKLTPFETGVLVGETALTTTKVAVAEGNRVGAVVMVGDGGNGVVEGNAIGTVVKVGDGGNGVVEGNAVGTVVKVGNGVTKDESVGARVKVGDGGNGVDVGREAIFSGELGVVVGGGKVAIVKAEAWSSGSVVGVIFSARGLDLPK